MAVAKTKGIAYADMTKAKKKQAEAFAEKWGIPAEKVVWHPVTGFLANREMMSHLSDEDYDIISKHYAEGVDDIDDEAREAYREGIREARESKLEAGTVDPRP